MKLLIAGATGFIGTHLVRHFLQSNDQITVVTRNQDKARCLFGDRVNYIEWPQLTLDKIAIHDIIINLTGANIGEGRWTTARKQQILSSRVETSHRLASFCAQLATRSPVLINASAIGVYGLQPTAEELPSAMNENTIIDFNKAADFLSEVGHQWELACNPAVAAGVRVVNTRFGVVMDRSGGVFKRLALPFKFFVGGRIGSGNQAVSWVSLKDLVRAFDFIIAHKQLSGPINIVSPHCLRQKELAKELGEILHRPSCIPTPAIILKLLFGQMAEELLLNGQHVKPARLLAAGFQFKDTSLSSALSMGILDF